MPPNKQIHYYFKLAVFILIGILSISLFYMQLIKGDYYKEIGEKNYVRIKRITPTRGEIYDQRYLPIAVNKPSINLYITIGKIHNKYNSARYISKNFDLPYNDVLKLIEKNKFQTYQEILVYENISYEKVLELSEDLNFYPELNFRTETMRDYLIPNHFTGYVGRINDKEYATLKSEEYALNSLIGKSGLEKYYESLLSGKPGYEIIQVDARGRNLNLFHNNLNKVPENGLNLILTLDLKLQKYTQQIMDTGFKGSAVVMDVRTGGILAYVSVPEFDQNLFTQPLKAEDWALITNNPNKPMFDRVTHGAYPPGSIFKPLTAFLGLDKGVITPYTVLESCAGGMQIGNRFFKCWQKSGHGALSLSDAMKHSCDTYFYDLSLKVSLEDFYAWVYKYKLVGKTGIDLPNERNGLFPDRAWYKKHYGTRISITGQKVNLAIGQGELQITPLQMCAFYAAIANDGVWMRPHLMEKAMGSKTVYYRDFNPQTSYQLPVQKEYLHFIQQSLYRVVNEPGGTGGSAKVPGVLVAGKTGSAENHMGPTTHAWFAGYATWEYPEIAVVVFMENAGHGGTAAAPIAAKIISFYNQEVRQSEKTTADKVIKK